MNGRTLYRAAQGLPQSVTGLTSLSRVIRSSYLCRRVFPLIDCELEQVLGGSTENEDNSGSGALFKVSCSQIVHGKTHVSNCCVWGFTISKTTFLFNGR